MTENAAAGTSSAMTRAKPLMVLPKNGRNRTAARVKAAILRWLVRLAAFATTAVLVLLIGYILVKGIPNLKPSLFAWKYTSDNVSLVPALINTVLMMGGIMMPSSSEAVNIDRPLPLWICRV